MNYQFMLAIFVFVLAVFVHLCRFHVVRNMMIMEICIVRLINTQHYTSNILDGTAQFKIHFLTTKYIYIDSVGFFIERNVIQTEPIFKIGR